MNGPRRSWLCPTDADYQRTLESYRETARARIVVTAAGILCAATIPTFGWPELIAGLTGFLTLAAVDRVMHRLPRPEWGLIVGNLSITIALGAIVAMSGSAQEGPLPLMALALTVNATRFRRSVSYAMTAFGAVIMLAALAIGDLQALIDDPAPAIIMLVVLYASTAFTVAHCDTEDFLRDRAMRDPLAGLLSAAGAERVFAQIVGRADSPSMPITVAVCDLDHFERVNAVHGEIVGDEILRTVACTLRDGVRPGDQVARLDGDTFLILAAGLNPGEASVFCERQRSLVAESASTTIDVTISIGTVTGPIGELRWSELAGGALVALEQAKAAGRNRVVATAAPTALAAPDAEMAA